MKELKLLEQVAINNANFSTYKSMAFDGDFYYFCVEGKKVIDIYNSKFEKVKICNVGKEYEYITYNSQNKYFYAIPTYHTNIIVKLDKNMHQIGSIDISDLLCEDSCITSISYSCAEDSMILSTKNKVLKISIPSNCITEVLVLEYDCIVKVLSVDPGYVVITEQDNRYEILIYDANLNIVNVQCIKKCNMLCDAVFNPCVIFCSEKCEKYATIYLLMNKENTCSKIYQIPIAYDEFGYDLCECNFEICKKIPKPCEEVNAACLIETIALIQTSIAHILNAEGEKIQKVVATSNNIQEILCVNKQVEQTIIKITHLEQILYDSLVEITSGGCCNCCLPIDNCCSDKDNKCLCDVDGGNIK